MRPVLVVGTGPIGLLLASRLLASGHKRVLVVTRDGARARVLRTEGVTFEGDLLGKFTFPIVDWATLGPIEPGTVVLLATKIFDLRTASASLFEKAAGVPIEAVAFCNGLDAEREWAPGAAHSLARASVSVGVRWVAESCLRVSGIKGIEWAGGSSELGQIMGELYTQGGIPTVQLSNAQSVEWRKALSNIAINGICALAQSPNGALLEQPRLRLLAEGVLQEAMEVAKAHGVKLEEGDQRRVFEIARATAGNFNSTLEDLRAQRRTEIPWLNGRIVALGESYGVRVDLNRMIWGLISALEERVENPKT